MQPLRPILRVVGHCTATGASILAVFGPGPPADARAWLAYRSSPGRDAAAVAAPLEAAPPYHLARFRLVGLPAGARVTYAVRAVPSAESPHPDALLAGRDHSFRLLPPDRPLRLGLLSCNGAPPADHPGGPTLLWQSLAEEIRAGRVDLLVHAGDQIYADPIRERATRARAGIPGPPDESLVERLASEYRQQYVRTWSDPDVQAVLASCPSVMMWDDHEIYDGYGSNREDDAPQGRALFQAACMAFWEFQAGNNPPALGGASHAFALEHAGSALLVLDGRTRRRYREGRILGPGQLAEAAGWLERRAGQAPPLRDLQVVVGLPPVHVPVGWLTRLVEWTPWTEEITDDLHDLWTAPRNRGECRALLRLLFDFAAHGPGTRVTLLAGAVHVATVGEISSRQPAHRRPDGSPIRLRQIVSSGIGTPPPSRLMSQILEAWARWSTRLAGGEAVGHLHPFGPRGRRILARRNFAVIEGRDPGGTRDDSGGAMRVTFFAEEGDRVERIEVAV
jgi:hypothetical protein